MVTIIFWSGATYAPLCANDFMNEVKTLYILLVLLMCTAGFESADSQEGKIVKHSFMIVWQFCLSSGAEGAKQQRPQVTDAEEKKSQMSADSGLSVTSGSQVSAWCTQT